MRKRLIIASALLAVLLTMSLFVKREPADLPVHEPRQETDQPARIEVREQLTGPAKVAPESEDEEAPVYKQEIAQLQQILYGAGELDAMIAGFAIARIYGDESDISPEEFVELALAFDQDDPLLLAALVIHCQDKLRDLPPVISVNCDNWLDELTAFSDKNGWMWIMHAANATSRPEQIDYLRRAVGSSYFTDFSGELKSSILGAVQRQAGDAENFESYARHALTGALGLQNSQLLGVCVSLVEAADPEGMMLCRELSGSFKGDTMLHRMTAATIEAQVATAFGEEPDDESSIYGGFTREQFQQYVELSRKDPGIDKRFSRYVYDYREIDAVKLLMIEEGIIEDDGFDPAPVQIFQSDW